MKKLHTFSLGCIEITVYDNPNLGQEAECAIGKSSYEHQSIELNQSIKPKDILEHTYYHELVHWILYVMGRAELCRDEEFVDFFSLLLTQALKTRSK